MTNERLRTRIKERLAFFTEFRLTLYRRAGFTNHVGKVQWRIDLKKMLVKLRDGLRDTVFLREIWENLKTIAGPNAHLCNIETLALQYDVSDEQFRQMHIYLVNKLTAEINKETENLAKLEKRF